MLYFPYFLIDITQKGEKYCATKNGLLRMTVLIHNFAEKNFWVNCHR